MSEHFPIDPFVSITADPRGRIVDAAVKLADYLVAASPVLVLLVVLGWTNIPALIAWWRERRYQDEWHRTFRADR